MTKIIIAIISLAIFTGCSGFIHTKKTKSDQIHKGISYYLPKRQHKLIVTAEYLVPEKEEDRYKQTVDVLKEFVSEANSQKSNWTRLQKIADNTPAGGKAKEKADYAAQTAEGKYKGMLFLIGSAKQGLEEAEKRLNFARMSAQAKEKDQKCFYYPEMQITPLPLEPDINHSYYLELNHSILRDDKMTIETTASGLITNETNVTTTDRTGDIIVEIAKTIAMFGVGFPITPSAPTLMTIAPPEVDGKTQDKVKCYTHKLVYETITDFTNGFDIKFNPHGYISQEYVLPSYKVALKDRNSSPDPNSNPDHNNQVAKHTEDCSPSNWKEICRKNNGILYRRDQTHLVELKFDTSTVASEVISMPNLSPVSLIPADSLFLVTTKNIATFKDGMLVKFDTDQPSQALEVVRLPARVLRGMLEAVTELIQLKVNYTNEQGKLVDAINTLKGKLNQQDTGTTGSVNGTVTE